MNKEFDKCSTCKYLKPINCHPTNFNIGNGNSNQLLGFVCTVGDNFENGPWYFFESDQGTCELHEFKTT